MKKHVQKQRHLKRRIMSMMLTFIMLFSVVATHLVPTEEYHAASNVYVAGGFNGWSTTADAMEQKWGNFYYKAITVSDSSTELKIVNNGSWYGQNGGDGNLAITDISGKVEVLTNTNTKGIWINTDSSVSILDTFGVYVAGTLDALGSGLPSWDTASQDAKLAHIGDNYYYIKFSFDALASDITNFEYKIAFNGGWDGPLSNGGGNFTIDKIAAGTTELEVLVDLNQDTVYNSVKNATLINDKLRELGVIVDATSVTLDQSTAALTINDAIKLNATVNPDNATDKTITWSSDNEAVATVDQSGNVTAKEEGTANITVTTSNGKSATCAVTVKDNISLNTTAHSLEVGASYALSVTKISENTKVSWASSASAVAEVSDTGVVKANATGTATITATTVAGATATCEITVTEATQDNVTAIEVSPTSAEVDMGKTVTLTAETTPGGKAVIWESSDEDIATVANGVVTGVSAGIVTITVKPANPADDTVLATCEITVHEVITLTPDTLNLVVGDTEEIAKSTNPVETDVTWTSNNPNVATVNNGVVTAVGYGTATITATTAGNNGVGRGEDTVTVNVREKVTLTNTAITLQKEQTADLAEVTKPNVLAVDKTLTWTSKDTNVATVNNGVVTAVGVGNTTLTATTVNGATATCTITVTKKLAVQATVGIHFRNQGQWQNVKVYLWNDDGAIPGYEAYNTYPGKAMEQDPDHPQWYTLNVVVTDVTKDIKVILSDNGSEETKTTDIVIPASHFDEDGAHDIWVYRTDGTYVTHGTTTDETWTDPFDNMVVNGNKVTFRYQNNNASSVVIHGEMNGYKDVNMTKGNDGVWTYTFDPLKAGVYKYRYIVDGEWVNDPENGVYAGDDSLAILPGIVLTDGVEAALGDSTKLPERMSRVLGSGEMESVAVSYALKQAVSGVSLKNGVLTVDESFSGNTVPVTVSNDFGDTATLDVSIISGEVVVSPVVDDTSVTFNYRNATATAVYVAGSWTDWGEGKVAMTKDAKTNIWSVTIPNMKAGTHQYKFVVCDAENPEGKWITDPRNDNVGIEGAETNSLVVVKGNAPDTNKITVKIHYTGRADYTKWNVWVWNDDMAKQIDFEEEENGRVATVELDNARASQYLKFIVRKGEWDEQEFGDRIIDLSDVLAGTVHVYVTSGKEAFTRELDSDALLGVKVKRADYDRTNNQVIVKTSLPVEGDINKAFTFDCVTDDRTFTVSSVAYKYEDGLNKYTLTLAEDVSGLEDVVKYYTVGYDGYEYKVFMPNVYSTEEFEKEYTYTGKDLGATWTESKTTFKLWAPTADDVDLNLYESGTPGTNDLIKTLQMTKGEKGVWSVVVEGNLHGTYYTYNVSIGGKTSEACDPYARTTGVNGKRAMVINLDSTDPEGWATDEGPNEGMNQTDAIIYELHVRDLSIDESSGIINKGKYLGVTETGTINEKSGESTGLDHIIDLGVTHIHFLPIYDYGSVDETKCDTFNWGYDPVNYNVPEGSYSTDPYNGEVRVGELKEMVQTLHENNINVVMDVVYNHVYDAGAFAFNQIVPDYFSRTTEDGNYSSTSGCGNDTASERDMVRKYIVESVVYWAKEYHIDGFRFDLVGLLDANTINQIVTEVHDINPSIIFYGEGWDMDSTAMNPREPLAKQGNAYLTPGFAYFSDTIRDKLKGKNTEDETDGDFLGYVNGGANLESAIEDAMMGKTWWSSNPTQIINYASCHDNYTLKDKINITTKNDTEENRIKMNNLSAAIYMLAEGVPLIHAGEEMLRTKVDNEGHVIHNSYKSPDYINSLKWDNLDSEAYQNVVDYYAGLVEFRKNHEALRLNTASKVSEYVSKSWIQSNVMLFKYSGDVPGEASDGIVVILNSNKTAATFNIYDKGVESGTWTICIDDENAGITSLGTVTDGNVTVDPISALVLVKGALVDEDSVYTANGYDPTPGSDPKPEVEVTSVKLNKSAATLHVEETLKLSATVNPSTATNKAVTWTTSDENVVTVNNGVVTAVGEGTATITVTTTNDKTDTCEITVVPKVVEVTEVTLSKSSVELKPGETVSLNVRVNPSIATDKTVTWTSTNENVAKVDKTGKITAVATGTATITATAGGKSATCQVTVTKVIIPTTFVILNETTADLKVGETVTLEATVFPSTATEKTVSWSSDNKAAAIVDKDGVVTAIGAGFATITATAGGKTATCTVTVTGTTPDVPSVVEPTSVTLNKSSAELYVGGTTMLVPTVNPSNATNKAVTWTTSNAKVATVNNGVVTGVAVGTATITVTTANNKTATCTVTVKENSGSVDPEPQPIEVTSITLDKTSAALKKGATVTLTATVNPSNATNKNVTWSTSNAKVATVDKAGKVTAVANGTATITAKAGTKTATCTVTVTTDVTNVTLNKSKANLGVGKKLTLKATVSPSDASNQKLTWSSSDSKIAKVDKNGKVTGVKAGTATITVKTANGKKATCKVTVVKATLNATSIPLQIKKSTTALKVTSTLKGDKVKSWKSSNKNVATVNKTSGKITAGKKTGTATITVTMKSGATATCKVTVQKGKVTTKKLVIDQKKVTLQKGKKVTLTVTRNPITATEKITWSSSNKKVATVTSKGVVTGKKAGTATITAKTSNGKKITCKVTVKNPTVKLVKTKATIKVGKTTTIKIKSTFPANDKVKSFTSSNKKIATVTSKGVVKGVKAGKATITVKMKSGATAKFVVTVKKK
ncbi:MAG: type I pullulanase [Agathobacter sp.]|nr:type I pullulanase [Agathobacter sp.]